MPRNVGVTVAYENEEKRKQKKDQIGAVSAKQQNERPVGRDNNNAEQRQ